MTSSAPARRLNLSVQYALEAQGMPDRTQIRAWIRAVEPDAAQMTVRFVDAEEGQALNAQWRNKDYATNVLSFPYEVEPVLMGDLVLCWPVVVREAKEQGKDVLSHAAHLIIHGTLHLQGFDHETEDEAHEMESIERQVMQDLGYADPYALEQ